ncbi:MAG TPA: hypothetical protein VGP33_14675, partial [Chloroflexota bacterium]|nr:hypothetical protein [Chloroflexota bacterium]
MSTLQYWELWYPDAAATGLAFARGRLEPTTVLWVHAAPPTLAVAVSTVADGARVARGDKLVRTSKETLPTTRLALQDGRITREDRWPLAADLGAAIILP